MAKCEECMHEYTCCMDNCGVEICDHFAWDYIDDDLDEEGEEL